MANTTDMGPISGVILAGGKSKRLAGRNKALLSVGEESNLARLVELFGTIFEETILVTNDPTAYVAYDLQIATDLLPVRSSLTGIHAGLFYAANPHVFVAACDLPFLKKRVVTKILSYRSTGAWAVMPETEGGLEPTCALYASKSLPMIERQIDHRDFKIRHVFDDKALFVIPKSVLKKIDPELISFFNINTPQDLETAQRWHTGTHSAR